MQVQLSVNSLKHLGKPVNPKRKKIGSREKHRGCHTTMGVGGLMSVEAGRLPTYTPRLETNEQIEREHRALATGDRAGCRPGQLCSPGSCSSLSVPHREVRE